MELVVQFSLLFNCQCLIHVFFFLEMAFVLHMITCDDSDTDPANARELLECLLNQPANKFCADCGIPDPKWA
jgi:hypothetical protein